MMRRPARSMRVSWVLLVAVVALAIGCQPGGDPVMKQAEDTCNATMEQDPQYASYAVAEAAKSGSSYAAKLLRDSVVSDDYEISLAAVRGLAADPSQETQPLLQQAFESKQGAARIWAAIGLTRLGDPEAIEWLKGQLEATTGAMRFDVAEALAARGEREAVEGVARSLMDSGDQAAQEEAYTLLGQVRQPWATELLLAGLKTEHGEDRREAIRALGSSGDPAVAGKIERFVNTQGLVFVTIEALGRLGNPESTGPLEAMLKKNEPLVTAYAGVALWKLGALADPQATLGPLLSRGDSFTKKTLAEQLGTVKGDEAALGLLVGLLETGQEPEVRLAAARSLQDLGSEGVTPYLVEAALDPDYQVATAALDALRGSNEPTVPEQLLPLLEGENPYVRIAAAITILDVRERVGAAGEGS